MYKVHFTPLFFAFAGTTDLCFSAVSMHSAELYKWEM
jgi:hypothetical protein